MIGEIRDLETAENAIQAALTGHLVFSTLHTNDSASAITRLIDIGIQPFLIQNTLVGILSQRLLRKICDKCSESFTMTATELRDVGIALERNGSVSLRRGNGCPKCRGTGYYGRVGTFEVLPYSPSLRRLTVAEADYEAIYAAARKEGMNTLKESAIKKMLTGMTTYHEVLRMT